MITSRKAHGPTAAPDHHRGSHPDAGLVLWCDRAHDPDENMRRDRAMLERAAAAVARGERWPAVVRLFRFAPHGLTLGRLQDPATVLDARAVAADAIPWAVRPTGGRAIFHADEWTYAMVAAIDHPQWGGTLAQACDRIGRLIVRSLRRLGVPAEPWPRSHAGAGPASIEVDRPRGGGASLQAACFAATTRHEITLAGRKLAGSAQRRTATVLLQQGTILLGPGHERLVDYVLASHEARSSLRRRLEGGCAYARPHLRAGVELHDWADALAAELPDARQVDGDEGLLLTVREAPSYTPESLNRGKTSHCEEVSRCVGHTG